MSVRLEWDGKPTEVERLSLPFQTVETINQSRATRDRDSGSLLAGQGNDSDHPPNQLIWGDNQLVAGSLLKEYAGEIKLIYIDPPFDTGTDFSFRVTVGEQSVTKQPSILEEHAYRDTWSAGRSSYLSMLYERLAVFHELLAEDGSLYLHCAPNVSHFLKIVCDEIFGPESFRNEIVWKRTSGRKGVNQYGRVHDVLLFYTRGPKATWHPPTIEQTVDTVRGHDLITDADGAMYRFSDLSGPGSGPPRHFGGKEIPPPPGRHWMFDQSGIDELWSAGRIAFSKSGRPRLKTPLEELPGIAVHDVWTDIEPVNAGAAERVGYETQKPVELLERVIESSSNPGDVVADFWSSWRSRGSKSA